MTRPRKDLISLKDTPYYHCVSRCVRRAFLCGAGEDYNFEHRRGWIVERIKQLAAMFTIDVAAYAIMSNHYHLVLRVDTDRCEKLTRDEIIERWSLLFKGPVLVQRYLMGHKLLPSEIAVVEGIAETWRQRLNDISWFMRCLNEHIARLANREDQCTGRFWEGRFKSQALLDERALISCMAYVDLNPIRAGMADRLETSDYTSIQERLGIVPTDLSVAAEDKKDSPTLAGLLPFAGDEPIANHFQHIPFGFLEYIQLVEWTGKAQRNDKRGAIDARLPNILQQLQLSPQDWLASSCHIESRFGRAIGSVARVTEFCGRVGQRWIHGIRQCRRLYSRLSL